MSDVICDRCHATDVVATVATSDAKWKSGGQMKMGYWPLITQNCQLCHSPYRICNPCFSYEFDPICNSCVRDKKINICLT